MNNFGIYPQSAYKLCLLRRKGGAVKLAELDGNIQFHSVYEQYENTREVSGIEANSSPNPASQIRVRFCTFDNKRRASPKACWRLEPYEDEEENKQQNEILKQAQPWLTRITLTSAVASNPYTTSPTYSQNATGKSNTGKAVLSDNN